MKTDTAFMRLALRYSAKAAALGEVPVGCVIVKDGRVLSSGWNRRESAKNALLHAELIAIDRACKKLGGWRLTGCTLYVTLEPCPMCTGALLNARIDRVCYGAKDPNSGCLDSLVDLPALYAYHTPVVEGGVLESECAETLRTFFRTVRKQKNRRGETEFPQGFFLPSEAPETNR